MRVRVGNFKDAEPGGMRVLDLAGIQASPRGPRRVSATGSAGARLIDGGSGHVGTDR